MMTSSRRKESMRVLRFYGLKALTVEIKINRQDAKNAKEKNNDRKSN